MEMENPRRPLDRSRESGSVKKPRLNEDPTRSFTQRSAVASRFTRTGDSVTRDSDVDDRASGAHQPQELVNQYKTALAELTFNSKPIITNLTIIAGENVNAAKAIAATVCNNILEVPSEQKLPSLYLLDSIVKNIGRDYIKYFAARLPEVFCKAYRQVDASVHQNMRHLFGTWKGVFPILTLHMIEKELGFTPVVNGSSSGATAPRSDSESQRPPQSIHVNPKYLERQRLQQSSRAKVLVNDMTGIIASSTIDSERPDRAASMSATRQWADPPVNLPNSLREAQSEPIIEKNLLKDYGSDVSRNSGLGTGRTAGRISEQGPEKPWYRTSRDITETISGQWNGFNMKPGCPNYLVPKSVNAAAHLRQIQNTANRSSSGISTSWKNSEEEEFMWDMHSRLSDQDAASISAKSRTDSWTLDGPEKLEYDNHLRKPLGVHDVSSSFDRETSSDSLSLEQKDQGSYGHQMSSPWQLKDSLSTDGLIRSGTSNINSGNSEGYSATLGGLPTSSSSSMDRTGGRPPAGSSHIGVSGLGTAASSVFRSTGTFGQQRFQSAGAGSPSGQPLVHRRSPSRSVPGHHHHQNLQNLAEQDYPNAHPLSRPDLKTSPFSGIVNPGGHSSKDSLSILPSNSQLGNSQKVGSSTAMSSLLVNRHYPFPQPLQSGSDYKQPEPSSQSQKPVLSQVSNFGTSSTREAASDRSNPLDAETSGQSGTSSLLAAVLKSGILKNSIPGGLANRAFQGVGRMPSQPDIRPPLPSVPPPSLVTSSVPRVVSGSLSDTAFHEESSATTESSQIKVEQPPLPPGPPTSSLPSRASVQTSNAESKAVNPISNLLSSLVAKGLISASKSESPSLTAPQVPRRMKNESPSISFHSTATVTSVPYSSTISPLTVDEVSFPEPATGSSVALPESTTTEIDNLIGLKFKPDVIREFHQSVVNRLFDDFPHMCSICGLRLNLQEQLDRHLEWHVLKNSCLDGVDKTSRRWYAASDDWVAGKVGLPLGLMCITSIEDSGKMINEGEPVVPADDNQCACVLCGELFEDYYSQARDEWMFKGAVYMMIPSRDVEVGTVDESSAEGPIVHANCVVEFGS